MANIFSNYSFSLSNIDMNLLMRYQTGFYPYNNIFTTYNGVVYEDVLEMDYYYGLNRYGIWGGNGITYSADYSKVTGGNVQGYIEYVQSGGSYVPVFGIEGFSGKATDFSKATMTASTADDLKLIMGILSGNDNFSLSNFDDVIDSGAGNDNILANGGDDTVYGGAGNDFVYGGAGNDFLYGGAGNDVLEGGQGLDFLDGGVGNDVYYADKFDIIVDSAGVDTLITSLDVFILTDASNIENLTYGTGDTLLIGNNLNNVITGNANSGFNNLYGRNGSDTIIGGGPEDDLFGGAGNDVLTGGTGPDWFYFDTALNAKTNLDRITDFSHGQEDTIGLNTIIFTQFFTNDTSPISAGNFVVGTKALDANDYLIYNKGTLYYDADGFGKGKAVAFAKFDGLPTLDYTDFSIYYQENPSFLWDGTYVL
jgi:Ca2+-binding RTX toxin-like protein